MCLAKECERHALQFVTFSSDLVFDGLKNDYYLESDVCSPLNVYGRSKAEAELRVLTEFARLAAMKAGRDPSGVKACPGDALGFIAPRPSFTALSSERGSFMAPFEDGLDRCVRDMNWGHKEAQKAKSAFSG